MLKEIMKVEDLNAENVKKNSQLHPVYSLIMIAFIKISNINVIFVIKHIPLKKLYIDITKLFIIVDYSI